MRTNTSFAPVSVIIPAYNAATFLPKTLESVYAQTLLPSEVIVIDDGSHDDTAAAAEIAGARVLRIPHSGLSAARNYGIRHASNPWVAFLDADDLWEPTKLAEQWAAHLLNPESGLITCDQISFSEANNRFGQSSLADPDMAYDALETSSLSPNVDLVLRAGAQIHRTGWFLFPSTVFLSRDLILAAGLFDERLPYCEDLDCFLRVLHRTSLIVVGTVLVLRRVHETNMTGNGLGMTLGHLAVIERMLEAPQNYPTRMVELMIQRRPFFLLEAGRALLALHDTSGARTLLLRSLRLQFSMRTAALWASSWLSKRHFTLLLATVRRLRTFFTCSNTS